VNSPSFRPGHPAYKGAIVTTTDIKRKISFNSSIAEAIIKKSSIGRNRKRELPAFAWSRSAGNGNSQSREEKEVNFEVITAAGTAWINDIRYYDCPTWKTTTFPLQNTRKTKKAMGEPWPSDMQALIPLS
jgi:hypothetical protein